MRVRGWSNINKHVLFEVTVTFFILFFFINRPQSGSTSPQAEVPLGKTLNSKLSPDVSLVCECVFVWVNVTCNVKCSEFETRKALH